MYYTRSVAKRIKLNNDCVDSASFFVSSSCDTLYRAWLVYMEQHYAYFDAKVHRHVDVKIREFTKEMSVMAKEYEIRKDVLEAKYPELFQTDRFAAAIVDREIQKNGMRKFNWIYDALIGDPMLIKTCLINSNHEHE